MRTLGQGHESEINVTPLIDVLLTLIVMFIVAYQSRFVQDLQVPPPRAVSHRPADRPIVLDLQSGGGYVINGDVVSPYRLAERIGEIFRGRPDKLLYVRVGRGWNYAAVMAAVDVAKGAGVEQIGYVPPVGVP